MKGIFDVYVLRAFGKKFIFELVMRVRTRDFTVFSFQMKTIILVHCGTYRLTAFDSGKAISILSSKRQYCCVPNIFQVIT